MAYGLYRYFIAAAFLGIYSSYILCSAFAQSVDENTDETPGPIIPEENLELCPPDATPGLSDTGAADIQFDESNLGTDLANCIPPQVELNQQQPNEPVVEWEKRQNADERLRAFGTDLLGDGIDPHTGSISFQQTDVSLPGNFDLEVAVRRKLSQGEFYSRNEAVEFADWQIDVPRIHAVHGPNGFSGNRCSNSYNANFPQEIGPGGRLVVSFEYSDGVIMEAPGAGTIQVLEQKNGNHWPSAATHVSTENWWFECMPATGGGQGFKGHAPNGDVYEFNRVIVREAPPTGFPRGGFMGRTKTVIAATKVTDVNGNNVVYTYDSADRLTRIRASDGRQIDLTYSGSNKYIRSITANGRSWQYNYSTSTFSNPGWIGNYASARLTLNSVTLPDGRTWSFNLDGMEARPGPGANCIQVSQTLSVTHPTGAAGTFNLDEKRLRQSFNGRMIITPGCANGEPFPGGPPQQIGVFAVDTMSVSRKTLTGPQLPTYEWTFAYEQNFNATPGSTATLCVDQTTDPVADCTNWTRVQEPDGRHITYYHLWNAEGLGGKLIKQEIRNGSASGSVIETSEMDYLLELTVGISFARNGPSPKTILQPARLDTRTVTRNGETYKTDYTYNSNFSSSAYSFGFPTEMRESSTVQSGARETDTTYNHNISRWVLGLPATVRRSGKLFDTYSYDTLGQVLGHDRFGTTYMDYTYNTDGTVATVTDALSRRVTLSNYNRGLPQSLRRPDNVTLTRVVDNNGWIRSYRNGRNHQTSMSYDSMGRLTQVNPPGTRATTNIDYSNLGAGIVQTATTGTQRIITRYDGMNRPYLIETRAISGGGGTIYNRMEHNSRNQVTFQSFPSFSSAASTGTNTTYDALGRVTQMRENVSPNATTTHTYLSGNRVNVSDPEGHITRTSYSGYGSPDDGDPVLVEHPGGLQTSMSRDIYGNLLSASQSGVTQTWSYDNKLRLSTHYTPEQGCSIYGYDAADQVTSIGHGTSSGCSASGGNIINTYDSLGRVTFVNYPSGTQDVSMSYDADSNLKTNNRGPAQWAYSWDENDQLLSENLLIDGRAYNNSYTYNGNGARLTWNAPNGFTWEFDPDGHGRPTGARWGTVDLLRDAIYFPNGQLRQMDYRNGRRVISGQGARQNMSLLRVQKDGNFIQHHTYARDKNGRITNLRDFVYGENKSFQYDGLGRVVVAGGPWGSGSYTYSGMGNLTRKTLASRTVEIQYDGQNRTRRYRDSAAGNVWKTFTHDARGNVTDNGQISFIYDRANQPIAISGADTGSFVYDGNYKRAKQTINGKTIYSVYSLSGELLWRDNLDTGVAYGIIDIGGQQVWPGYVGGFIHTDHLGSVAMASNGGDGGLTWREDYTPFGEARLDPPANDDNPNFTGHIRDHDTGLVYAQARYYDPVIGRFLSADPVGFMAGGTRYFNRYTYTFNDPVNAKDPGGEDVVVLYAPIGFGADHTALLVGREGSGWLYVSRDGRAQQIIGRSTYTSASFSSLGDAFASSLLRRYNEAYRKTTTTEQDDQISQRALEEIGEWYDPLWNNCGDLVKECLGAGGVELNDLNSPNPSMQRGLIQNSEDWADVSAELRKRGTEAKLNDNGSVTFETSFTRTGSRLKQRISVTCDESRCD
ncbi:MAG: RHS repeat-associated core domain-containing protein [Pseudomonadota bacterium]